MKRRPAYRVPPLFRGVLWALMDRSRPGLTSRIGLVARTAWASLAHRSALQRWMMVASEQAALGFAPDYATEYLRAVRPYVHGRTGVGERVKQLIDHADWFDSAFEPRSLALLSLGEPLVLTQLPAPAGFTYIRLLLQRAPAHSPEGELLLTLSIQRDPPSRHAPVDAAALGFSHFRVAGTECLVIGGVRGLRDPLLRISPIELSHALNGWKPGVLMVRVAQELARVWDLRLVALDPRAHRLHGWWYRRRAHNRLSAKRIASSYKALWEHFAAHAGPPGWMVLPAHLDNELEATSTSPERRARQTLRADYWIRLRNMLRLQLRTLIKPPSGKETLRRSSGHAGPLTDPPSTLLASEQGGYIDSDGALSARVSRTGPADLV